MRIPLEDRLPYTTLTLLVLAAFYGIYFAKVLAQKRRGIQTRQIGRRKEKNIHTVEVLMSIATLGAPIAQLMSIALGWNHLPAGARFTGFLIGMLGDGIFLLVDIILDGGAVDVALQDAHHIFAEILRDDDGGVVVPGLDALQGVVAVHELPADLVVAF